jgi:hypothetical protein
MASTQSNLTRWHQYVDSHDPTVLDALLHDDVIFHSPVVHTPQRGKAITTAYLLAASKVLFSDKFVYAREIESGNQTMLEFNAEIDDISINGVDIIEWTDDGKIIDFKVMVRPLKAVQKIHQKMGEMLAQKN